MEQANTKRPEAQVFWPRAALAGCIFGAFLRDTRNYPLEHEQRFNHFAAAPYCCLTWFFEGQAHIVDWPSGAHDPASQPPMYSVVLSGPQRKPTTSWNPGPINAMTLVLYPDALAALSGMDVSKTRDCIVPVDTLLTGPLLDLCNNVLQHGNAEERFQRIQDGLEPLWQQARPPGHAVGHRLADWSRTLAIRAATSGAGRSVRQIERRIRAWGGQSRRDILNYSRTEQAFAIATANRGKEGMSLAQLAADAGFADQSHMTRHVRRETGFTPEQLRDRIENDETFWCYRLMAERF
jgi:AraC-like DNA-binding protein